METPWGGVAIRGTQSLRLAIFLLAAVTVAHAQQETGKTDQKSVDPKTTTRITLGSVVGEPGAKVVVPVYFTPAEQVKVGRVKLEIKFVSRNLKFSRIEKGIIAEAGNFEVESSVKEEKNEQGLEISTLTLATAFPAGESSAIPSGLLAYLNFEIQPEANAAEISLRVTAEAAELGTNQPVRDVRAADSRVTVLASGTKPLISCFFFSH